MKDNDELAWLDGELAEFAAAFERARARWGEHLSVPVAVDEAAVIHETLLGAQLASVIWCLKCMREQNLDEHALSALVALVGSLDTLMKGRPDPILSPILRPPEIGHRGVGRPKDSVARLTIRFMAVYSSRVLQERGGIRALQADEWIASALGDGGVSGKGYGSVTSKTVGNWRREPGRYLSEAMLPELNEWLDRVPQMAEGELKSKVRKDLLAFARQHKGLTFP